ncbi:MAG: hypothetical protein ACRENL_05235 [Candidatus Dormibacteria bacterium]
MSAKVSSHAIARWRERVAELPYMETLAALESFIEGGRSSRRAPRWACPDRGEGAGANYLTNVVTPGICLLVVDNVVITVLTRQGHREMRRWHVEGRATARRKALA